ncbi:MAG: hypothetical protein MZU84_05355 [Sphingobacterium sp.]|nr:hypothetical protein [Sphingobacterium sp.]
MALCGLLFPVDAAFKRMGEQVRCSYPGSASRSMACRRSRWRWRSETTPTTLLTLAMGAVLYGWMTWRYRTLPPLYLLFGCVAGLYGFGILNFLPPAWHGLASLPGLLALLGLWPLGEFALASHGALQCLATCWTCC